MKRFLLSAVLLSSIGVYAQELPAVKREKAVGIETTEPRATLDVNGDARLQKVELMTTSTPTEKVFPDCPCVLTIDEYGVIKRIPKSKFVLTDGSTGSVTPPPPPATTTYSSTKSYTATGTYKNQNCGSGKVAEDYTVSHKETFTADSDVSQEDADKKALDEATRLATQWVKANGQQEANRYGECTTKAPEYSETRVCNRYGDYVGDVAAPGVWYTEYGADEVLVKINDHSVSMTCSATLDGRLLLGSASHKNRFYRCENVERRHVYNAQWLWSLALDLDYTMCRE